MPTAVSSLQAEVGTGLEQGLSLGLTSGPNPTSDRRVEMERLGPIKQIVESSFKLDQDPTSPDLGIARVEDLFIEATPLNVKPAASARKRGHVGHGPSCWSHGRFQSRLPFLDPPLSRVYIGSTNAQEGTMFGIGIPELIIILVIVLIIFGANKLPEIGSGMGRAIKNFKKATSEPEEIDVTSSEDKEKTASKSKE